jgi:thiol-disulfide isomerase/thioredoxin
MNHKNDGGEETTLADVHAALRQLWPKKMEMKMKRTGDDDFTRGHADTDPDTDIDGHGHGEQQQQQQQQQMLRFAKTSTQIKTVNGNNGNGNGNNNGGGGKSIVPNSPHFDEEEEEELGEEPSPALPEGDCGANVSTPVEVKGALFEDEFEVGLSTATVVLFYKPHCPFCIRFEPVYQCLYQRFKDDTHLRVVQFNSDPMSNDEAWKVTNDYGVSSYPTVRFFPKGYKRGDVHKKPHGHGHTKHKATEHASADAGAVPVYTPKLDVSLLSRRARGVEEDEEAWLLKVPKLFFGLEYTGSTRDVNLLSKLTLWTDSIKAKTTRGILHNLPATRRTKIGLVADGDAVAMNGMQVPAYRTALDHATKFYITNTDNSLHVNHTCLTASMAPCLTVKAWRSSAAEMPSDVCMPYTKPAVIHAERESDARFVAEKKGIKITETVWYRCMRPGQCHMSLTVNTAPENLVIKWVKECGSSPRPGLQVGSTGGLADIVRDGVVQDDWRVVDRENIRNGGDDLPFAKVLAEDSSSFFQVMARDGIDTSFVLSPHLSSFSDPPNILRMSLHGDQQRDTKALKQFRTRHSVFNAAKHKKAHMSSVWQHHKAALAVDGKLGSKVHGHLDCAVSGNDGLDAEPYWEVDLGVNSSLTNIVKQVRVWNTPTANTQYRLVPFYVLLSSKPLPRDLVDALQVAQYGKRFTSIKRMYDWTVKQNDAFARYVRVQLEDANFLQLAEVEVFVVPPEERCTIPIADSVDPFCRPVDSVQRISTTVQYTCLKKGKALINYTLPLYPTYAPSPPLRWSWVKHCDDREMDKLNIGTVAHGLDVVDAGAGKEAYTVTEAKYYNMHPELKATGQGQEREQTPAAPNASSSSSKNSTESKKRRRRLLSTPDNTEGLRDPNVLRVDLVDAPSSSFMALSSMMMTMEEANATNSNSTVGLNGTNATNANATNSSMAPAPAPSSDEEEVKELEEEEEAPPTDYRVVPGEEHRTKFWTQSSVKGLKQPVAITVTSSDGNVTLPEILAGTLNHTITGKARYFEVAYRCKRRGFALITVRLTFLPEFQPYKPLSLSFEKQCGGPRPFLHVYRSVPDTENPELAVMGLRPANRPGSDFTIAPPAVMNGTAMEGYKPPVYDPVESSSDKKEAALEKVRPTLVMEVGEEETSTVFFVKVPPTERNAAKGATDVALTVCSHSSSQPCSEIAANTATSSTDSNKNTKEIKGDDKDDDENKDKDEKDDKKDDLLPTVSAICEPNICSGGWAPFFAGSEPALSGEAVGYPERDDPAENGTSALILRYHCSSKGNTTVSVTIRTAFYEPVTFSFKKQCLPWSHTGFGSVMYYLGVGVAAVGVIAPVLLCTEFGHELMNGENLPKVF